MDTSNNLERVTKGLNHDELQEFADALDYLQEGAQRGFVAESGGVSTVLNRLSPRVRERFNMISELIEQPRFRPFAEKYSEAEQLDKLGFDPVAGQIVKDSLDGNYVAAKVLDRLGGADKPSTAPPTRREQIAAALEAAEATPRSE